MDGLLLDTETTYFIAWQQAAQTLGYEFSQGFCQSLSGLDYSMLSQEINRFCGAQIDITRFFVLSGEYWRVHVQQYGIALKPGFDDLLQLLLAYKLPYVLATNSALHNARECLQLAGVEHLFTSIISRDKVQTGKPAPDILYKAAESLNLPISACVVVEDSLSGLQAAKSAGAFSVLIPSQVPATAQCMALAGIRLTDLSELAEIIQAKLTRITHR